jgi:hypothetical protein
MFEGHRLGIYALGDLEIHFAADDNDVLKVSLLTVGPREHAKDDSLARLFEFDYEGLLPYMRMPDAVEVLARFGAFEKLRIHEFICLDVGNGSNANFYLDNEDNDQGYAKFYSIEAR